MEIDWVDIAVTLLTTGLFALIGFVWRWSHKVTEMKQELANIKRRVQRIESEHDKVSDKMYAMVKDRSAFLTRETYREDSKDIQETLRRLRR